MPTVWYVVFDAQDHVQAAFVNTTQADAWKTAFFAGGYVQAYSVKPSGYLASPITFGPGPMPVPGVG